MSMDNQNKCDKYEAYFVFQNEEAFNKHLENCEECRKEHEKYLKVSKLVKEVSDEYLKKMKIKSKKNTLKKIACCFTAFIIVSSFSGVKLYEDYNFQVNYIEGSYVSAMGLPTDDYGFLEL